MEEKKLPKRQESFAGLIGRKKIASQMYLAYLMAIVLPIAFLGGLLMRVTYVNQKNYYAELLKSYNTGVKRTMYEITSQIYTEMSGLQARHLKIVFSYVKVPFMYIDILLLQ